MIAADARCAKHPETPASGTCARCGTFICPEDTGVVDAIAYCAICAVRPDVGWLEGYRQSKLGKRSSTEWALLLMLPLQLIYGFGSLMTFLEYRQNRALLAGVCVLLVASAVNGVLWFSGIRNARRIHLVLGAGWVLALLASIGPELGAMALLPAILVGLIATTPLTSVPSKLFFRLPVERAALLKSYHSIENNPFARYAFTCGVVGLLLPGFPIAAIAFGALAWSRVDLTAKPPIGKRGQAILGVALGVMGLATSSALWWQQYTTLH